jgi:hypothetical protein
MTLRKQRWIPAACYSYDVTCNKKAGRRSYCICARAARVSRVRCQICRDVFMQVCYPPTPGHLQGYSESRRRGKSTNRDNLHVAAGSLETLAWSVR